MRHALGALLLEAATVSAASTKFDSFLEAIDIAEELAAYEQADWLQEAEEVFRADLICHPNNLWALRGLLSCLRSPFRLTTVDDSEAVVVEAMLTKAMKRADFRIDKACFCAGAASKGSQDCCTALLPPARDGNLVILM